MSSVSRLKTIFRRVSKCCIYTLATAVIVSAAFLGMARAITPYLSHHKARLERFATALLGQPVSIAKVSASWYGFEPVFQFSEVTLLSRGQRKPILHAQKIKVGINLFSSLWHRRLARGLYVVSGVNLRLNEPAAGWTSLFKRRVSASQKATSNTQQHILDWLLAQDEILLQKINLRLNSKNGNVIPLSGIEVLLKNNGDRHEISGFTSLAQTIASKFLFYGLLHGDDAYPDDWRGKVFIQGDNIVLPQWEQLWQQPALDVSSGKLNAQVWLHLAHSQLTRAQMRFQTQHVFLQNKKTQLGQLIQQFSGHIAWLRQQHGWQWSGDELHIKVGGHVWPLNRFIWKRKNTGAQKHDRFFVNAVRLQDVLPNLLSWLPDKWEMVLKKARPQGVLNQLNINWQSRKKWTLQTQFHDLAATHWKSYPGFGPLNGQIDASDHKSYAHLQMENFSLIYPKIFRRNLNLSSGNLNAWVTPTPAGGWQIKMPHIVMDNQDMMLAANTTLSVDKNFKNPAMQMIAYIDPKTMNHLANYLPMNHTSPRLRHWLDTAIQSAGKAQAVAIFRGAFKDYPFIKKPGQFTIDMMARDVTMRFQPQWPLLKHANAMIEFNKRSMKAYASGGTVSGIPVNNFTMTIPHLGDNLEVLHIDGSAKTSIKHVKQLIANSPLRHKYGFVNTLDLSGNTNAELHLAIPFHNLNKGLKINGRANFKDANLDLPNVGFSVKHIKGALSFDRYRFWANGLKAAILNHPAVMSLKTLTNNALQVRVKGKATITRLDKLLKFDLSHYVTGTVPYFTRLLFAGSNHHLTTMHIDTNLKGGKVLLPKPFDIPASKVMPWHLEVSFMENGFSLIAKHLKHIAAKLWFDKLKGHYNLQAVDVHLGKHPIKTWTNSHGIVVSGHLKKLYLKPWWAYWLAQQKQGGTLPIAWREIKMHFNVFNCFGEVFKNVRLDLKPDAQNWKVHVNAPAVEGDLEYLATGKQAVFANMTRLYLPKNSDKSTKRSMLDPGDVPNLNVHIKDFRYKRKNIGTVDLLTAQAPHAMVIKKLSTGSKTYQFQAGGEWVQKGHFNKTVFEGRFTSKKLAKTLTSWGMSPAIDSRNMKAFINVGWDDTPTRFALKKLNGAVNLQLKNGRITHLSKDTQAKVGLGKLLSILSLQTLPRRLTLNFSDISNKGFPFDKLKGTFKITKGNAVTSNTTLDGSVAYASVKGSIGLADEDYDMVIKVAPHITASLPIIATIAGGPIVGAVAWIANKILSHEMRKVASYTYSIKGPWKKPIIKSIKITRQRELRRRR
jgi:uncharacterized protein (TIGR02099 family)